MSHDFTSHEYKMHMHVTTLNSTKKHYKTATSNLMFYSNSRNIAETSKSASQEAMNH